MKFRKRPVEVEATQFTNDTPYTAFTDDHATGETFLGHAVRCDSRGPYLLIPTLEGDMRANSGDWIVTGVKGEQYPCKPDVFLLTYEAVETSVPA